jgi:hypothetical protein
MMNSEESIMNDILGKYNIKIDAPLKEHQGRIYLYEKDGVVCGEIEVPEGKSEFSNVEFNDNSFVITYDSNIPMPTTQTLQATIEDDKISGKLKIVIRESFSAEMTFAGQKSRIIK